MPAQYEKAFKMKAVSRYERGETILALCQEIGIAQGTLYRWIKEFRTIKTEARTYTPFEFDALSRRLDKAEHILEVIRLSKCISEIPLQKKLMTLEKLHEQYEQYSVYELCEALDVARGPFYNHIFRRADRSKYIAEQEQLMIQVQQVFNDSKQRFGAEKIRIVLAENGIHVSAKRISSIMQELDLRSIRTNAKKQYKKRQQYLKRNLLERDFKADQPNQTWVSDITYFKVNNYWLYLCAIIDLYSRRVVGYRVSRRSSTNLVTATFRAAFEARGNPQGLTFHSDRGSQYVSGAFMALLQKSGAKQSFSASGRPYDNAVAETFFATFKKEEAYRRDYTSEQDFRKSVDQYIQFYNEVRPHQTIAYKTPARFEEMYRGRKQPLL